jgi:hypothetical protein
MPSAAITEQLTRARWLLQSRDLLKSDVLPLTQEFLSITAADERYIGRPKIAASRSNQVPGVA